MWYRIKTYLTFLWQSTNQHGVHSPFVYQLITKCFYDKTNYSNYNKLIAYKKRLLKNKNAITVTDLGSGSKYNTSIKRKIATIAKHSGSTLTRTKLLFRLTQYFNITSSLELGTSLGLATQALSLHNKNQIITIEGCPQLIAFTKKALHEYHKQIQFLNGNFTNIINTIPQQPFDLVFFDGNHTKTATLTYFNQLLNHTHNDTLFIFDDIYWSKNMTQAWETIKQHPKVTVTIDTYFWGFVFFRKEQAKQHFKIRL